MNKKLGPVPKFRNKAEERRFWETHSSSDRDSDTNSPNLRVLREQERRHQADGDPLHRGEGGFESREISDFQLEAARRCPGTRGAVSCPA